MGVTPREGGVRQRRAPRGLAPRRARARGPRRHRHRTPDRDVHLGAVRAVKLDPKLWWYVARAGGVVALVLASLSVVWGTALSSRLTRRPRPAWMLDLHRFLGGLTVTFVAVHIAGLVADSYTHWGWADV